MNNSRTAGTDTGLVGFALGMLEACADLGSVDPQTRWQAELRNVVKAALGPGREKTQRGGVGRT